MGKQFKRWLPLVGTGALVASVVLRMVGEHDAAATVEGLANATGLSEQAPVTLTELAGAGAAVTGIVMKVRSMWVKAKEAQNTVSLR